MRANKAPFAFGLEPRVPFLDKAFLDVSMAIDPAEKMVQSVAPSCLAFLCPLSQDQRHLCLPGAGHQDIGRQVFWFRD